MKFDQNAVALYPKSSKFSISAAAETDGNELDLVVAEPGADLEYKGVVSVGGCAGGAW